MLVRSVGTNGYCFLLSAFLIKVAAASVYNGLMSEYANVQMAQLNSLTN